MDPSDKYLQNARKIFKEFSHKPGSEHIATISSLTNIITLIKQNTFENVVEIGSGIGTIAKLILENTTVRFYAYETNEWCIDNLKLNTQYLRSFDIFDNFDSMIAKLNFNYFLIIDDYLNWKQVWRLMSNRHIPDCIFIEGYRNK